MKIYPYQTPEGVIELVEKREYDKLLELAETRRQTAQNYYQQSLASEDRATKNLREVERLEQANAELIERLAEARESHLHASARDVQTIQRQSVELASADREIERLNLMVKMMDESEDLAKWQTIAERPAVALQKCLYIIGDPSAEPETLWRTDDELNDAYRTSIEALAAGSAQFGGFTGPPIDFREWWESKDHTYGGDATPIAIAGMAWEASHRKYAPPAKAQNDKI